MTRPIDKMVEWLEELQTGGTNLARRFKIAEIYNKARSLAAEERQAEQGLIKELREDIKHCLDHWSVENEYGVKVITVEQLESILAKYESKP